MKDFILSKFPKIIKSLYIYERENCIELSTLIIFEDLRSQGYGRTIMKEIINYANNVQKPILLTPQSPDGFLTDDQLIHFYESLGFLPNKGSLRDYSMPSQSYIKLPN